MKIKMIIQSIIAAIKLKYRKHRYAVTPLGDCQIRYIINKYINQTKLHDFIEAYEEMITNNEERALHISYYRAMCVNEEDNIVPERVHIAAAILSLVMLLFAAKNVNDYYELIVDDVIRQRIQMLVNIVG